MSLAWKQRHWHADLLKAAFMKDSIDELSGEERVAASELEYYSQEDWNRHWTIPWNEINEYYRQRLGVLGMWQTRWNTYQRHYADQAEEEEPEPEPEEYMCSICQGNCEYNPLPCGHHFHSSCLLQWTQSGRSLSNTCPNCRAPIQPQQSSTSVAQQAASGHEEYLSLSVFRIPPSAPPEAHSRGWVNDDEARQMGLPMVGPNSEFPYSDQGWFIPRSSAALDLDRQMVEYAILVDSR